MSYELEGVLHKLYDIETKGESFQVREMVVQTEGNYPQFVKLQLTQDRCSALDGYKEGEKIKVSFDLRGREWQGKYFTNLNAWKVQKAAAAPAAGNFPPVDSEPPAGFESVDAKTTKQENMDDFGDLPF